MARVSRHCTINRAMIYDRGGERYKGEVKRLSLIEWNRDRDGQSEARLTIESGRDCRSQRRFISELSEKRHELVIFRGNDRVWEGPIFRIGDEGSKITLAAKDVTAYLFGTMMTRNYDNRTNVIPMTTRLANIIAYELANSRMGRSLGGDEILVPAWESLDPALNVLPYLTVHNFPNEAQTAAFTRAFQTTVGLNLADAARSSGIDYAAIGRAIHLWDTSRYIHTTRTLTEADFYGDVIVTGYGADHTQGAYVSGQDGTYGEAINPDGLDYYGPWMSAYTQYNEEGSAAPTQAALNSQAARNTSGRSPVPFEVRIPDNSSIRLNETLGIQDLIPGARVPLLATLNSRARNQMQKIDHVTVTETAEKEDIKITLSPASREDADEEE